MREEKRWGNEEARGDEEEWRHLPPPRMVETLDLPSSKIAEIEREGERGEVFFVDRLFYYFDLN